jgi:hypothetical protein
MTTTMKASISFAAAFVVLLVSGVLAAPAHAATTSVTQRQVSPGVQQRVIWSRVQVAQYAVRVSHAGYLHAQVNFTPGYDSCSVFIWDPGAKRIQNIDQGWYPVKAGRAAVDFFVPDISDAGRVVVDSDGEPGSGDEYLKGDVYNVIVCREGSGTRFNVWGYAPQTDPDAGSGLDPTGDGNVYYSTFRRPASGWRALAGAPSGGPFGFVPTSAGEVTCDLTWPAAVARRIVLPDLAQGWAPAVWEQYLYVGSAWDVVVRDALTPTGTWWPPQWDSGQNAWWGLSDTVTVRAAGAAARPMRWFHYVPALDLVSSDPTQGPAAPLKTGVVTMGYRATLTWPANLWISRAPRAIKRGASATIRGTFALNGGWVAGASVALQKSVGGVWRTVRTVKTDANGRWTTKVQPRKAAVYRARARGDETTGRAFETSLGVTITVH